MDNPQHYQPLGYALHPPVSSNTQNQSVYTSAGTYNPKLVASTREEEEEDEDDDDDEGTVEQQLNRSDQDNQGSHPPSPRSKPASATETKSTQQQAQPTASQQDPEPKRRPGRPRGSKNRRPRSSTSQTATKPFVFQANPQSHTAGQGSAPPQHPDVNPQNQQYYEFQWRVLNLCKEFYEAAEELIKDTPALVIAQCYQMGPSIKVDPIIMLDEAKRICDTLLANPSRLISSPPPPMYPVIPPLYQPIPPPPTPSAAQPMAPPPSGASTSKAGTTPSAVINQPQSFVVSMGAHSQYPVAYAPAPGHYPTAPYYHQYPTYAPPGATYYSSPISSIPQAQAQPQAPPQPPASTPNPTPTMSTSVSGVGGNQGAWSDEETERLRKLVEESKAAGHSGEQEWDWIVQQWGNTRTRHQILIKGTQMGLKESTTRGTKRRRGDPEGTSDTASPAAVQPTNTNNLTMSSGAGRTSSPHTNSQSQTPIASPSLQNQQRPNNSNAPSHSATPQPNLPWPMPVIAANTPSPVIPSASEQQRATSYYRPRPSETSSKPLSGPTHSYLYQSNGSTSSSRLTQNGK